MTPSISLAGSDDLPAAATLAAAFADYPWTRYVIPEDDHAERLRAAAAPERPDAPTVWRMRATVV